MASVSVDGGPACSPGQADIVYTTVVVCAPGSTTNCQAIDHIQVDTASYGLRLISQALQPALASALPVVMESQSGQVLAECTPFADGYSWGPIKSADIQIAGEKAPGIEVQVIGDPTYQQVPSTCSGTAENTVPDFGANGIIGVGPFVQDCGGGPQGCTNVATNGYYYVCASPSAACTAHTVSLAQQMSNPVAFFTNSSNGVTDNNGVIIQLPSIAAAGAQSVQGSLIFGVDTESNNASTNATNFLPTDPNSGYIWTEFDGQPSNQSLTQSYIDSGSNALYFVDGSLPACIGNNAGFYCPTSVTSLSADIEGNGGSPSVSVQFPVADADSLSASNAAFDDLAGCPVSASGTISCPSSSSTFDWGVPFFFGRSVYTVIACAETGASCKTTLQGFGPYVAF